MDDSLRYTRSSAAWATVRAFGSGVLATVPMTAVMRFLHHRLPREERYPLPPYEIVSRLFPVPPIRRAKLALVSHLAAGGVLALAYPVVRNTLPGRSAAARGAVYGAVAWAGYYQGVLPALRILKPASRQPLRRNLLMLASHLVWGACASWLFSNLDRESVGVFKEIRRPTPEENQLKDLAA